MGVGADVVQWKSSLRKAMEAWLSSQANEGDGAVPPNEQPRVPHHLTAAYLTGSMDAEVEAAAAVEAASPSASVAGAVAADVADDEVATEVASDPECPSAAVSAAARPPPGSRGSAAASA